MNSRKRLIGLIFYGCNAFNNLPGNNGRKTIRYANHGPEVACKSYRQHLHTFGFVCCLRDGDIKQLPRIRRKVIGRAQQSNSTSVAALSADR